MLLARTLAAAVLPSPMSATGVTVVTTGGVILFVLFGSPVGEVTLAMLVSEPLAGAVTVTLKLVTCPLARLPKVQVTTPTILMPPPLADTKVTPAGKVSVTVTLLALDGPKFVTLIV